MPKPRSKRIHIFRERESLTLARLRSKVESAHSSHGCRGSSSAIEEEEEEEERDRARERASMREQRELTSITAT
jgi:hypothetical protein